MAGLLDFLETPAGQGLLAAGLGAAASYGRGRGLLGNLGAGGLMGLQAYGGAQDRQMRTAEEEQARKLRGLQIQQAQTAVQDQQDERDLARRFFTPATPGAGGVIDSQLPAMFQTGAAPVPAQPAKFDLQGFAQARMAQNPIAGMKLMAELQKEKPINKLDVKDFTPESVQKFAQTGNYGDLVRMDKLHFADTGGGIAGVNPFTGQPVATLPKTGNPFSDLVIADGRGGVMPNSPLVSVKRDIANAGAARTNVSVNTDKSYFGNVAEGLAKNDVALIDAARSAPDRIASSQRVKQILAQNPITGTGAESRLALNKALATAGLVDGKDVANTEMLASTLASQTLDAIKTSGLGSGQGFTDKDRQFLERAKSGNIEMNSESLRRIADLNEQSARATIRRGNTVIGKLRSSPEAGKMGQQLDLVEEPTAPKPARSVVRQGVYGGRKVIQYSDGTVEYAN